MPSEPTVRDVAADVLRREDRREAWVRDLLPAARGLVRERRDRGLLTELAYGVVRRRGTLDAVLAARSRWPLRRLAGPVRTALRLALYQVLFLDRVPAHAAVDHAVAWTRRHTGPRRAGYVNGVLRACTRMVQGAAVGPEDPRRDVPREDGSAVRLEAEVFADPARDPAANLADRFSHPRWLVERWLAARGAQRTRALLHAGIVRPPLALRARGDRDALLARLRPRCPGARAGSVDTAILVEGPGEGAALEAVEAGEAWVQDATAQRVAPLLGPRPGQHLLDLCAAPGGKTIHLVDLLEGRGEVIACDVDEAKVAAMAGLARHVRGGVTLRTARIPSRGPLPFEPASFDGILVDAPCTNTGVLRRRVEARWRLAPEHIPSLAAIQADLLERSLPLLRPGGRLVYTTCSLEAEENAGVVDRFLAAHPELTRLQTLEAPAARDADGGYAAVLCRPG